jgi:hypothetical protein
MRYLQNKDGIALITALMFTLVILVIIMAMLQFVIMGSKMSGSQKRYRNSLEASYGGVEIITKEFIPKLFVNYSSGQHSLLTAFGPHSLGENNLVINSNLKEKMIKPTADWSSTLSKTINPKDAPDIQFKLNGTGAGTNYNVYGKIVDTVPGNSDPSGMDYLGSGVGVAGTGAGIAPKHTPALFTIEVQGELATGTKEKAALSVLYAY